MPKGRGYTPVVIRVSKTVKTKTVTIGLLKIMKTRKRSVFLG
jgi:hypothetical protein